MQPAVRNCFLNLPTLQIPAGDLSQAPQLSTLDVSGNPVRALNRDSLRGLFLLRHLRVSNMTDLDQVSSDVFADNLKLKTLEMEGCPRLQPLPWGIFRSNPGLEELLFTKNAWTTLSPLQVPLASLKKLRIEGLPLHCNCSVLWLWDLYNRGKNSTIDLDQVRCASVAASAPSPKEGQEEKQIKGGVAGDPLSRMARAQLICQDWSSVLMAVSIAVLVTVLLLVLASLVVYRCRRYRLLRRSPGHHQSCLHIKDDTMVYKSTLHPTSRQHQYGTPTLQHYYVPARGDYSKTVSSAGGGGGGGYSPTPSSSEPFYEVPKYVVAASAPSHKLGSSSPCSDESSEGRTNKRKQRVDSNKSSSESSSGYVVGSELWDDAPPHVTAAPGYANTVGVNRGAAAKVTTVAFGSPQSTSTGLSSTGSSSNASSTSSSNGGGASRSLLFHSPATLRDGRSGQWFGGSPHHQLSPPSSAPIGGGGGSNAGSRTMLLHQFSSESPGAHFGNRRQQQQGRLVQHQQHQQPQGSLGRGNGARSRERSLFV